MGENKDIRGLLQTEFEHYEADPGVDLWPEIEAELKPKKKRAAIWWTYTVAAASIMLLFGSLFWLINQEPEQQEQKNKQIVKIDSVWKEKTLKTIPDEDKESLTEERIEEGNDTPDRKIERRIPAPAKSYRVRNTPESFADQGKPATDKLADVEEKPKKRTDINVSQIAMQTMGPGFSPITDEIERQTAPKIKPSKENVDNIERVNMNRQFANNKNSIDLNNLTAENAVSFVSNGLSKLKNSPVEFYQEKGPEGELKVYQLDFLNFKITKKTRKAPLKKL
jgi:hypothetical protein